MTGVRFGGEGLPDRAEVALRDLARALLVGGPSPCQQSAVPDAWFEPKLAPVGLEGCQSCPLAIQSACLTYALVSNERYGIWGGQEFAPRRQVSA